MVVGVGASGDLPELPGARTDARRAAAWAEASGYEVTALVDDDGTTVAAASIYDAVQQAVAAGDVDRLVLFFAGHGVAKGAALDFWLLSAGPDNPNESVNVDASLRLARTSGIPHVAVFADACRTAVGAARLGMEGYVVFPDAGLDTDVEVDRFLATRPGFVARERAPTDAVEAFGVFTDRLLDALDAPPPAAVEPALDGSGRQVVALTAGSLKRWLVDAVGQATRDLAEPQEPDCLVGSTPPRHIYRVVDEVPAATVVVRVAGGRGEPPVLRVFADDGGRSFTLVHEGPPRVTLERPIGSRFDVELERDGAVVALEEPGIRTVTGDMEVVVRAASPDRSIGAGAGGALAVATTAVVVDDDGRALPAAPASGRHVVVDVHPLLGWTNQRHQALDAGERPVPAPASATVSAAGLADLFAGLVEQVAAESAPGLVVVRDDLDAPRPRPADVVAVARSGGAAASSNAASTATRDPVATHLVRVGPAHLVVVETWPGCVGTIVVGTGEDGPEVRAIVHMPAAGDPDQRVRVAAHAGAAVAAGQVGALAALAAEGASIRDVVLQPGAGSTLDLFLGHGLDQRGRVRDVVAIADRLRERHGAIGADLAVLSGRVDGVVLPTLASTWALLGGDLPPAVAAARAALAPTLFATVVGPAGEDLAAWLRDGGRADAPAAVQPTPPA